MIETAILPTPSLIKKLADEQKKNLEKLVNSDPTIWKIHSATHSLAKEIAEELQHLTEEKIQEKFYEKYGRKMNEEEQKKTELFTLINYNKNLNEKRKDETQQMFRERILDQYHKIRIYGQDKIPKLFIINQSTAVIINTFHSGYLPDSSIPKSMETKFQNEHLNKIITPTGRTRNRNRASLQQTHTQQQKKTNITQALLYMNALITETPSITDISKTLNISHSTLERFLSSKGNQMWKKTLDSIFNYGKEHIGQEKAQHIAEQTDLRKLGYNYGNTLTDNLAHLIPYQLTQEEYQTFTEQLRQQTKKILHNKNITQKQLAKDTNIDQQTISSFLNQKKIPRKNIIGRIATTLIHYQTTKLQNKQRKPDPTQALLYMNTLMTETPFIRDICTTLKISHTALERFLSSKGNRTTTKTLDTLLNHGEKHIGQEKAQHIAEQTDLRKLGYNYGNTLTDNLAHLIPYQLTQEEYQTFTEQLRQQTKKILHNKNITQTQLAKDTNIDRSTLSRFFKSKKNSNEKHHRKNSHHTHTLPNNKTSKRTKKTIFHSGIIIYERINDKNLLCRRYFQNTKNKSPYIGEVS